jgi:hypothetical protein
MAMVPSPKCNFVRGLPSWSLEILKIGILVTLKAHNFLYIPLIEMRYKEKL